MKPRLIKSTQADYVASEYTGQNLSGIHPVGKTVLVMMDRIGDKTPGGVMFTDDMAERMNMAAESGVIVEVAEEAFVLHDNGLPWKSRRPQPGDHVYVQRYAGILVMGRDNNQYRVMDQNCIAGVFDGDDYGKAISQ